MDNPVNYKRWDLFISYASEDKEDIARPLAHLLDERGYKVWFDEFTIEVGDSINEKINEGLASSQYGVVIISHAFMSKRWPQNELNALVALERHEKRILPIWHGVTISDVERFSPILADRYALTTDQSIERLVSAIADKIGVLRIPLEPKGVDGLWHGISGRLIVKSVGEIVVGEYDWFGRSWIGQLKGHYEDQLFRFVWDWNIDHSNGEGFFFRVSYKCDLRVKSEVNLYRLVGGWVYQSNVAQLDVAIEQYNAYFHAKSYRVYEEMPNLPRISALRPWDFNYDLQLALKTSSLNKRASS
jgi:hypothetical protein